MNRVFEVHALLSNSPTLLLFLELGPYFPQLFPYTAKAGFNKYCWVGKFVLRTVLRELRAAGYLRLCLCTLHAMQECDGNQQ